MTCALLPATTVPMELTDTPARLAACANASTRSSASCTGSRNRRRRQSTSPVRRCRETPDPSRYRTTGSRPDRSRRIHQTPQSFVKSPARPSDTSIAALACSRTISAIATCGCGIRERPTRTSRAAVSVVAAWILPPLRMASPSAASPIVPVTITRSPAFAPLR